MKKKDQATKHDGQKVMVELVEPGFVVEVGRVLTFGARKYAPNNWRKGLPWSRTLGATLRHLFAWAKGEEADPESGLPHLAHAACNLMFLMEWSRTGSGEDDRIKGEINTTHDFEQGKH